MKKLKRLKFLKSVGAISLLGATAALTAYLNSRCFDEFINAHFVKSAKDVKNSLEEKAKFVMVGFPQEKCMRMNLILGQDAGNQSPYIATIAPQNKAGIIGEKIITYSPIVEHLLGLPAMDLRPNLKICWQYDAPSSYKMKNMKDYEEFNNQKTRKFRCIYTSYDNMVTKVRKTAQFTDMNDDGIPDRIEIYTKKDTLDPNNPRICLYSAYTTDKIFVGVAAQPALSNNEDINQDVQLLSAQEILQLTKDYQSLLRLGLSK